MDRVEECPRKFRRDLLAQDRPSETRSFQHIHPAQDRGFVGIIRGGEGLGEIEAERYEVQAKGRGAQLVLPAFDQGSRAGGGQGLFGGEEGGGVPLQESTIIGSVGEIVAPEGVVDALVRALGRLLQVRMGAQPLDPNTRSKIVSMRFR